MIRRIGSLGLALALVALAPAARADAGDATAQAEALFRAAQGLRAAGKYVEASEAFARSKELAPGIGVSLYLADCYEHLGKSASAWTEFRDAEKRAKERQDKRADVARRRAAALEPLLSHVRVVITPVPAANADVRIDGTSSPPAAYPVGVAIDPGDHEVTLRLPGQTDRSSKTHVDPGKSVTVTFEAPVSAPIPSSASLSVVPIVATSVPVVPDGEQPIPPRTVATYSLLGLGAIGLGAGAGFLSIKNGSMSNGGPSGSPTVDQSAAIESAVSFGIAGVALATAVVLYLTPLKSKDTAIVVAPGPVTGGAGAFVGGSF